jgi:hypothetical protein
MGQTKPALRVLSEAHAVALSVRQGGVDRARIAALCHAAEGLDAGHPVRHMVEAFRARQAGVARDPVALAEVGADLQRDVLRALRPDPVDGTRADIHG